MIDASQFGENLFHSKLIQDQHKITIVQRGWLFGVIFWIISFLIFILVFKENISISGKGFIAYGCGGFFWLIGLLYFLYQQEIIFDFSIQRLIQTKGIRGFTHTVYNDFSVIQEIQIKKVQMISNSENGSKESIQMWDIGLKCYQNQPMFDLWRACDYNKAQLIAKSFSDLCQCPIKEI